MEVVSPRTWIGKGCSVIAYTEAGPSLSRRVLWRDLLSLTQVYLFFGCENFAMYVLCCDPGYLFSCTLFLHVTCVSVNTISLYVACIELVWCRTNMYIGIIDFTCSCGNCFYYTCRFVYAKAMGSQAIRHQVMGPGGMSKRVGA